MKEGLRVISKTTYVLLHRSLSLLPGLVSGPNENHCEFRPELLFSETVLELIELQHEVDNDPSGNFTLPS